jgi:hypothetical protein
LPFLIGNGGRDDWPVALSTAIPYPGVLQALRSWDPGVRECAAARDAPGKEAEVAVRPILCGAVSRGQDRVNGRRASV